MACFLEDLKCWEAWDTTCGQKAMDIIPSITWRREALGLDRWSARRSSLKGREKAIVNQTNIGASYFKGNVRETSERRDGAHMGFSQLIDTIELNWTELNKILALQICLPVLWYKHPEQSATRNATFLMTVGLENTNKWSYDLLDTFAFPQSIIPVLVCNSSFLNYILSAFWY